jgi:HAD superfamily hydrolase (TIGR01509 family)
MPPTAIVDVDGTLVDSNYHHTMAFYRAFRQQDVVVPIWKIQRHIGMGSDNLVKAVAGEDVDAEKGEDIRSVHSILYNEIIADVPPLAGARAFLETLKQRGLTVVLASSAKAHELDHYLDLLDLRELVDDWTTSADVEATKPEPDLILAALEKAGTKGGGNGKAVMVGDSTWDCVAATRANLDTIGLRSGGFSEMELRDAGALMVFENVVELRERLDDTPLATG